MQVSWAWLSYCNISIWCALTIVHTLQAAPQVFSLIVYALEATNLVISSLVGVLYINVTAWRMLYDNMIQRGDEESWIFPVTDQTYLMDWISTGITLIPDTFNWKPYWGEPQAIAWGRAADIKILHLHGPKLKMAICMLGEIESGRVTQPFHDTSTREALQKCHYSRSVDTLNLLSHALRVDKGALYRESYKLYQHFLDMQ